MLLKNGEYYRLYRWDGIYNVVVKIVDPFIASESFRYVYVHFIKVPGENYFPYKYPILKGSLKDAKKLTYEEVVALLL